MNYNSAHKQQAPPDGEEHRKAVADCIDQLVASVVTQQPITDYSSLACCCEASAVFRSKLNLSQYSEDFLLNFARQVCAENNASIAACDAQLVCVNAACIEWRALSANCAPEVKPENRIKLDKIKANMCCAPNNESEKSILVWLIDTSNSKSITETTLDDIAIALNELPAKQQKHPDTNNKACDVVSAKAGTDIGKVDAVIWQLRSAASAQKVLAAYESATCNIATPQISELATFNELSKSKLSPVPTTAKKSSLIRAGTIRRLVAPATFANATAQNSASVDNSRLPLKQSCEPQAQHSAVSGLTSYYRSVASKVLASSQLNKFKSHFTQQLSGKAEATPEIKPRASILKKSPSIHASFDELSVQKEFVALPPAIGSRNSAARSTLKPKSILKASKSIANLQQLDFDNGAEDGFVDLRVASKQAASTALLREHATKDEPKKKFLARSLSIRSLINPRNYKRDLSQEAAPVVADNQQTANQTCVGIPSVKAKVARPKSAHFVSYLRSKDSDEQLYVLPSDELRRAKSSPSPDSKTRQRVPPLLLSGSKSCNDENVARKTIHVGSPRAVDSNATKITLNCKPDSPSHATSARVKSEFDPKQLRTKMIANRTGAMFADRKSLQLSRVTRSNTSFDRNELIQLQDKAQRRQSITKHIACEEVPSSNASVESSEQLEREASTSSSDTETERSITPTNVKQATKSEPPSFVRPSLGQRAMSSVLKFSARASMRIKSSIDSTSSDCSASEQQTQKSIEISEKDSALAIAEANLAAAKKLKQQALQLKKRQQQYKNLESQQQQSSNAELLAFSSQYQQQQQHAAIAQQQAYQQMLASQFANVMDANALQIQRQLVAAHQQRQQQQAQQQQLAMMAAAAAAAQYQHQQLSAAAAAAAAASVLPTMPLDGRYMIPTQQQAQMFGQQRLACFNQPQQAFLHQQAAQQMIPMAVNHHSSVNVVYAGANYSHKQHLAGNNCVAPTSRKSGAMQKSSLGASMRRTVKSILKSPLDQNKPPVGMNGEQYYLQQIAANQCLPRNKLASYSDGSDGDGSSSDSTTMIAMTDLSRQMRSAPATNAHLPIKSALKKTAQVDELPVNQSDSGNNDDDEYDNLDNTDYSVDFRRHTLTRDFVQAYKSARLNKQLSSQSVKSAASRANEFDSNNLLASETAVAGRRGSNTLTRAKSLRQPRSDSSAINNYIDNNNNSSVMGRKNVTFSAKLTSIQ